MTLHAVGNDGDRVLRSNASEDARSEPRADTFRHSVRSALGAELAPSPDTFVRIEDKFFLPRLQYPSFLRGIEAVLKPNYPSASTRFTRIESIYFDSEGLDVYLSHFSSAPGRFKLRLRRYFPNGTPYASETHLELKSKENGVSKKARFKVGDFDCSMLQRGMPITVAPDLMELNPQMSAEKLTQRVGRVNRLLLQYRLRPKCAIRYSRNAYEGTDGGEPVRLTIDEKINYQLLTEVADTIGSKIVNSDIWSRAATMRGNFTENDVLLIEVKHTGTLPPTIAKLLASHGAKQVSFSKYCYSVTDRLTGK